MAYSRSFSGWRYRYRYGSRSSRRWRSGSRRRATGNAIAARHQRDAATVTINRIGTYTVNVLINTSSGATSYSLWNELRLSEFYSNYAPMYDQVKMDKVRIKLTGFRAGSAQTDNISPSVVLAFDRNGIDPNQQITAPTVATYSSAQLKQWSNGNSFTMYQTIYPSTIMEKGQYIPTGSLADPATVTASSNPCSPNTDPTLPFKPLSLIAVDLGANVAAAQTFAFTVEFEFTVTFRGMRKPSLSSSPTLDLEAFIDTFTSNGRYTLTAEQAGVDGWDSVDITVNVPPPDSQIDAISIYGYTNNAYYLASTLSIQDLSFTTMTESANVNVPPNNLLIGVVPNAIPLPNDNLAQLYIKYNSSYETLPQYLGANTLYALVPSNLTGTSGFCSLNVGSDPVVYSVFYPNAFDSAASFYVDHEDLSLILN